MRKLLGNSFFLTILIVLSLPFSLVARAKTNLSDGQIIVLSLPEPHTAFLGLGAQGLKIGSRALHWRLHAHGNSTFSLEALEGEARWLAVNRKGRLALQSSDSALSTRWRIEGPVLGLFTLENTAAPGKARFMSSDLALSAWVQAWTITERGQAPDFPRHGDTIQLKTKAGTWLDGNTPGGSVGLVANNSLPNFSGTRWRLHDNQDGSFSVENLGTVPGRRWLREENGKISLGKTTDRGEATSWLIEEDEGGIYLRNRTSQRWLGTGEGAVRPLPYRTRATSWELIRENRLDPAVSGRWSAVEVMPIAGIHTHVLPNGKVLAWSRFYDPKDAGSTTEGVPIGGQATYLYDPLLNEWSAVPNAPSDIFCSGHTLLPDGRLFVNGGHVSSYIGTKSTLIFDYRTNSWETRPEWDMNEGRWYPTTIALADGDVFTLSGNSTGQTDYARTPQVWSTRKNEWRDLPALASSCMSEGHGPCLPLYPWLHLQPDNRLFVSGPGKITGFIDTKGDGEWTPQGKTNQGYRGEYEATSVMYDTGKILIAGGFPTTRSAEVIDLNAGAESEWRAIEPMNHPRHKLTSTILADGSVLVSGGTAADGNDDAQAVFEGEIFDPLQESWTKTDHLRVPRLYHSTAVLLPDGRVLSMGGGLGAGYATHANMQIYSPPYLFRGDRPVIDEAPAAVKQGKSLRVMSRNARDIAKVHLIRLSSDTHSFNSSQHILRASFSRKGQSLKIAIPANPALSPTGHYILFLLDKKGVPSLGQIVRIDRAHSKP